MKLLHSLLLTLLLVFGVVRVSSWQLPQDLPDGVYRVDFHDDPANSTAEGNRLGKRSESFTITRLGAQPQPQPQRRGLQHYDPLQDAQPMIEIINTSWEKFKKYNQPSKMELYGTVTRWKDIVEEKALSQDTDSYMLTPIGVPDDRWEPPSKDPKNIKELHQWVLEWVKTAGEILGFPAPTYYNPFTDGTPTLPAPVQFLPERPEVNPGPIWPPKGKKVPRPPDGLKVPLPISQHQCGFNVPRLNRRDYEQARDGLLAYCDDFMVPKRSRHIALSVNGDVAAFVCNGSKRPDFCSRDVWDWVEANYFDRICHPRVAAWVHSRKTRLGYGRGWKNMKMCVERDLTTMSWVGSATNPLEKEKAKVDESEKEKKKKANLA